MNGIREVLSPLLFISYVLGTRIVEFPAGEPRLWCGFLYMLLFSLIYHFLLWYTIIYYIISSTDKDSVYVFQFCIWLNILIAILSIFLGVYHDKKYRTCLRQLDSVDDTLGKIGMITDYQKLYTKMLLNIFGWFMCIICTTCSNILWYSEYNSALYSFYISFMVDYPSHVNILNDLLITGTLRCIELKFEQINKYLQKLDRHNKHRIKRAWEHPALLPCQNGYPTSMSKEYATWVIIHLHLELCKISRDLNSMFGLQMTIKMGAYFAFIAIGFRELFVVLLTTKYNQQKTLYIIVTTFYLILNIFRLFIINYMCERINIKANATRDFINNIPYSTFDVVIRENISQFLLQSSLTPLKFYGLGLFQFGLNFFYGFSSSVSTVIVILVQSYTEK